MRFPLLASLFVAAAVVLPGAGQACSRDDTVFFETFLDTSCLQLPLTNTTLDALGGLRLTTNGTPVATAWDTTPTSTAGSRSRTSRFRRSASARSPARHRAAAPLEPAGDAAAARARRRESRPRPDGSRQCSTTTTSTTPRWRRSGRRTSCGTPGTAEDGAGPAIFRATSTDGTTWTRANGGARCSQGTAGAFDEDGVYGARRRLRPRRRGRARIRCGTRAAPASSERSATPPRLTASPGPSTRRRRAAARRCSAHGAAGSADSFSAADPTVLKDGSTWKMWYTGDDSSKKRIAYATSSDGITWAKGGKVIAPEDAGVSANIAVRRLRADRLEDRVAATRCCSPAASSSAAASSRRRSWTTSSADGIAWAGPSPARQPVRVEHELRLLEPQRAGRAPGPGRAEPVQALLLGQHDRRERELPHAHRPRHARTTATPSAR